VQHEFKNAVEPLFELLLANAAVATSAAPPFDTEPCANFSRNQCPMFVLKKKKIKKKDSTPTKKISMTDTNASGPSR